MFDIKKIQIEQSELSQRIIVENDFIKPIKVIAGCDVEYNTDDNFISAAIVLLDYQNKEILEVQTHSMELTFPYIPGLFSYREMPPIIGAYRKLQIKPDIICCDGHGIAHPRRFGLASHLGIELDIPTIGCAKKKLYGKFFEPKIERGAKSDLIDENTGEVIGNVLRTQSNVKPVFVSVGHKVNLNTACEIVLNLSDKYRLPETTRIADAYALEEFLKFKMKKIENFYK